jgi:hypothetical protein
MVLTSKNVTAQEWINEYFGNRLPEIIRVKPGITEQHLEQPKLTKVIAGPRRD